MDFRLFQQRVVVRFSPDSAELGGQSLQAMRLCTRIGAAVGVGVSMSNLFDFPTVAQLAAFIDARRGSNQDLAVSR